MQTFSVFSTCFAALEMLDSVLLAVLIGLLSAAAGAENTLGIPLKPDPPIAIDGSLSDWQSVPNSITLGDSEQVVYGQPSWTSPADLSGRIYLCWREEALYLAADVTDDKLSQTGRGADIWRGDNVMVFLDLQPMTDPQRTHFQSGQFQIALSPGNLDKTGDSLLDAPAQAYCFQPEGTVLTNATVIGVKTATGYALEAALPWKDLGVVTPMQGMPLRAEIALSDSDSDDAHQESMMTSDTRAWEISRTRLRAAALAGTDGIPSASSNGIDIIDSVELTPGAEQSYSFIAPPSPANLDAVLSVKARLHYDVVAGYTPALQLTLDGHLLDASRLLNKPQRAKARSGDVYSLVAGERFSTFYSPDFTSPDSDPHYGLVDGYSACTFELRVTDLLRVGENTLIIAHKAEVPNALVVAEGTLLYRPPAELQSEDSAPPSGPLPRFVPLRNPKTDFTAHEQPDALIEITLKGETFLVSTRFSTPAQSWTHGSNEWFQHHRSIERKAEAVIIKDTFTNLTDAPLPLMHRHEIELKDRLGKAWLAGLDQPTRSGNVNSASNPTAYAGTGAVGIGMLPLDDVFRIHSAAYVVDGVLGLADNNLVLAPKATYTCEWAIAPTETADYWRFLNAVRRLIDVNFPIDGGFAFLRNGPLTEAWSDDQLSAFIRFKDPRYLCASIDHPRYNGYYTHGTAFQRVDHTSYRDAFARWRRLDSTRKDLVYFHCFIDVVEDGPQLFADALHLGPDGKQADYGNPIDRLYIPLNQNSFGPAIAKNVDVILDEIGADGVYWDEHEYSRSMYHYGQPWDGYSGDVDPQTMTLRQLKSSTTLLTESWRLDLAKKILARGALIGNGPPFTRAMTALRFPCFVETGSITHCAQAHLYSPIALGDHLTERNEVDAYHTMLAALDYGCVYHWYNDMTVMPTHRHLTSYMFPITPIELHEGYIIGEERIVTNRSGSFGWGDNSRHDVHVFDQLGQEVPNPPMLTVIESGSRYTDIRIPKGWSAAIVRHRP